MSWKYERCLVCCLSFFPFLNWRFLNGYSILAPSVYTQRIVVGEYIIQAWTARPRSHFWTLLERLHTTQKAWTQKMMHQLVKTQSPSGGKDVRVAYEWDTWISSSWGFLKLYEWQQQLFVAARKSKDEIIEGIHYYYFFLSDLHHFFSEITFPPFHVILMVWYLRQFGISKISIGI